MEEIAFSEWSERLDVAGSNHWLPAYGYQEAMLGRGADDDADGTAMLIAGQSQQFLFLETIVEETSDDLRSESDKSGQAGWLDSDSDSDTGSVIHVPRNLGCAEWSGSERDLAVPKKRRRRTEDEDEDCSLSSRSSSLLQFECLEKHCEGVNVDLSTLCDSLDSDSLESSDEDASSDGTLHHSSWSSRDSCRLRSYRSFDSLNLLQQHKKHLSLSLNTEELTRDESGDDADKEGDEGAAPATTLDAQDVDVSKEQQAIRTQPQRSVENLSEDSGFGDHIPRLLNVHGRVHSATIVEDEDSYSSSSYDSDYSGGSSASAESEASRASAASSALLKLVGNLNFMEGRGWDAEESKFNTSCWQSAPNLQTASSRQAASGGVASQDRLNSLPGSVELCVETVARQDDAPTPFNMANRLPVASTPNLVYSSELEAQHSLVRVPLKHFSLDEEEFEKGGLTAAGSAKGVHFCPVVSELSWRESYSEDEGDSDESDEDNEEEEEEEGEEELHDYDEDEDSEDSGSEGEAVLLAESLVEAESSPPTTRPHVYLAEVSPSPVVAAPAMEVDALPKKRPGRFGGFFQRFSFRRRRQDAKKEPTTRNKGVAKRTDADYEDVTIIPLHPPPAEVKPDVVVSSKPPLPPLPPRVVGASFKAPASRRVVQPSQGQRPSPASSSMSGLVIDRMARGSAQHPTGLLETDLDTDITVSAPRPPLPKKARSLLSLQGSAMLKLPGVAGSGSGGRRPQHGSPDHRAKSMEFLLDKENQASVQPPENELQKIGTGERVMSEHQLRVQRSLQKLNIPDWYKTSVAGRPEGFRLKREQPPAQGWPGLGSKTTSLSSLGSSQSAAARSPTGCHLLSPSPTPSPHVFTRWSTSRLNSSTATSTSTSPCGSTRSSFNYRQPYLGWRSQERLTRPRTPAERLAAGMPQQQTSPTKQQVPNLSEVRTSIKEVTSAIVHYVSGVRDNSGGDISHNEDSPNHSPRWEGESLSPRGEWGSVSRSSSPRGSGRLCWLESSFVGSRPLDSPETPITLPTANVNKTIKALDNDIDGPERISSGGDLYLDFNSTKPQHQHHNTHVNGEYLLT